MLKLLSRLCAYRLQRCKPGKHHYQNVECGNVLPGLIDVLEDYITNRRNYGIRSTYRRGNF